MLGLQEAGGKARESPGGRAGACGPAGLGGGLEGFPRRPAAMPFPKGRRFILPGGPAELAHQLKDRRFVIYDYYFRHTFFLK